MTEKNDVPVVTVLVPTYNQESTIARCLDSVLSQRVDFGIRILVVDDASTDGTARIIEEYAARDARIEPVLRKENHFLKGHLSDLMWRMDTEFWIIVEGDDYLSDDQKLALQVDVLRRHPECSMCAHKTEVRDAQDKVLGVLGSEISVDETVYGFEDAPHCHTTARLYRGIPAYGRDFFENLVLRDLMLFYAFLDKGKMVALNRTMSVYCYNRKGAWSSLDDDVQKKLFRKAMVVADEHLDFRHHKFFRQYYLPREEWDYKEVFSLSIPFFHGKRVNFSIKKFNRMDCKECLGC